MIKKTLKSNLDLNSLENGRVYKVSIRFPYDRKAKVANLKLFNKEFGKYEDEKDDQKRLITLCFIPINAGDRGTIDDYLDSRNGSMKGSTILVMHEDFAIDEPDDNFRGIKGPHGTDEIQNWKRGPVVINLRPFVDLEKII